MDMDEHPDDIVPSRAGHSIGRWEDGALIVDTIGFEAGFIAAGPGGLVPHSEDLHVVERFAYDAETQGLTRSYTAEDPRYFTEHTPARTRSSRRTFLLNRMPA